jgi:hypothetical protein
MEQSSYRRTDLMDDAWEKAVNKLGEESGSKVVFFRIALPSGIYLDAGGFQPLVEHRQIHIRLQPQSPSYAGNDELFVSIPTEDLTGPRYKAEGKGDAVCLSVGGYIGQTGQVAVEFHLSTSRELLEIVASQFHGKSEDDIE